MYLWGLSCYVRHVLDVSREGDAVAEEAVSELRYLASIYLTLDFTVLGSYLAPYLGIQYQPNTPRGHLFASLNLNDSLKYTELAKAAELEHLMRAALHISDLQLQRHKKSRARVGLTSGHTSGRVMILHRKPVLHYKSYLPIYSSSAGDQMGWHRHASAEWTWQK